MGTKSKLKPSSPQPFPSIFSPRQHMGIWNMQWALCSVHSAPSASLLPSPSALRHSSLPWGTSTLCAAVAPLALPPHHGSLPMDVWWRQWTDKLGDEKTIPQSNSNKHNIQHIKWRPNIVKPKPTVFLSFHLLNCFWFRSNAYHWYFILFFSKYKLLVSAKLLQQDSSTF